MNDLKCPPYLKKGDCIGIVCPAGELKTPIEEAVSLFTSWGLKVKVGPTVGNNFFHFAGTDAERTADLQKMLDDPEVRAIFAARGGYGTVRIIDSLNFDKFRLHPKWIVGYSDITVLHMHIQSKYGIPTIHGQMPNTLPDATKTSLESVRNALFGTPLHYSYKSRHINRNGTCRGTLIGGNLAILASIAGSESDPDYAGKVLFIEDVGEYHYNIDRMIWMLKRAGKLNNLKGLILGGFTALRDEASTFGFGVPEIIMECIKEFNYPVATDFPAGHISNHKSLVLGKEVHLRVDGPEVSLNFN